MLQKAIEFLEKEYTSTKEYLDRGANVCAPTEVVYATIHSCLGVTMFVQTLGVEFEEIGPYYEETLEKLRKLLDK